MAETDRLDLTEIMTRLGGLLFSEETLQSALDLTANLARDALPGSVGGGVTLIRRGKKYTAAYTDDIVEQADSLQYDFDQGPCLSAWRENRPILVDDAGTEQRWPRWAAAAAAVGVRSAVSAPLRVRGEATGAIKAYSHRPWAYDDSHELILGMLADHAAIVLANVEGYMDAQQVGEQLKVALLTRDVIGQAKGILMATEGIDDEAAFAMLRQASQTQNVKLREVARAIVETTRGKAGRAHEG